MIASGSSLEGLHVTVSGEDSVLSASLQSALRLEGARVDQALRPGSWPTPEPLGLLPEGWADIVIHLDISATSLDGLPRDPSATFAQSLNEGLGILQAAVQAGVPKVVLGLGAAVYPPYAPLPFCEEDLWEGLPEASVAPRAMAHRALIYQTQLYRREGKLATGLCLLGNLYGPGQDYTAEALPVIPDLIRRMAEAQATGQPRLVLRGAGWQTRDFLYISDAVQGLVLAAKGLNDDQPVNISSGQEYSIHHLASQIAHRLDYTGELVWDLGQPSGQNRRHLDLRRASELLGFAPKVFIEEGLDLTLAAFRAWKAAQ